MSQNNETARAFASFRALESEAHESERSQLFRNMAQLFSFVSDRCEDSQVEQYDEVLCQLAELVEVEARTEVAKLLAPLQRAPGTVVVKLANDEIEVAKPLLEFSNVLSDDDLIEIVQAKTEDHRVAIAGRSEVTDRVGDSIVSHGGENSVSRLAENDGADLAPTTLGRVVEMAAQNETIAQKLRMRSRVDWNALQDTVSEAGKSVLYKLTETQKIATEGAVQEAAKLAFNRLQNRAGFSGRDWNIAWNQIKALSDRRQLEHRALVRFAKFAYGHHLGAAMTLMLGLKQEVFVKWLATRDHKALAIAARTLGLDSEMFARALEILPWRDEVTEAERVEAEAVFERLDPSQAELLFATWRSHGFRKVDLPPELQSVFDN